MNNIILLEKKHKKTIDQFFQRFPVTSLYIYKNIKDYGIENNGKNQHADYYGYFSENKLKGLCGFHNAGITILSTPQKYSNFFSDLISQKSLPFLLTYYPSVPDVFRKKIIKNEDFMILKNPTVSFNKTYFNNINISKSDIIDMKSQYEREYWKYEPDKEHFEEFERAVSKKIIEDCVTTISINNEPAGIGFIETYSKKLSILGSIYVKPEFRGTGTGRKITLNLIKASCQKNLIPCLSVNPENKPALELYKNLGFKKISQLSLIQL